MIRVSRRTADGIIIQLRLSEVLRLPCREALRPLQSDDRHRVGRESCAEVTRHVAQRAHGKIRVAEVVWLAVTENGSVG